MYRRKKLPESRFFIPPTSTPIRHALLASISFCTDTSNWPYQL